VGKPEDEGLAEGHPAPSRTVGPVSDFAPNRRNAGLYLPEPLTKQQQEEEEEEG
jgi:hypothetical protein